MDAGGGPVCLMAPASRNAVPTSAPTSIAVKRPFTSIAGGEMSRRRGGRTAAGLRTATDHAPLPGKRALIGGTAPTPCGNLRGERPRVVYVVDNDRTVIDAKSDVSSGGATDARLCGLA